MNRTGLLIALFLGWCGGYRFYKKQYFLGLLYLFTFGVFCFGWLLDVIMSIKEYNSATNITATQNSNSNTVATYNSNTNILTSIHTKVVGVTYPTNQGGYESRQEALENMRRNDTLYLEYFEFEGAPAYRVVLERNYSDIGNLRAELSEEIYKKYKNNTLKITEWEVTGGYDQKYGCNIKIDIYK